MRRRALILLLGLLPAGLLPSRSLAGELPLLRGDVTVRADVLTLADLVENAPASAAAKPLFRAPAFGETGTIQTRRIVEAAAAQGLAGLDTGGRAQVTVTRAGRRIGVAEVEAAVKRALEPQVAADPRSLSVVFDGTPPQLVVAPDLDAPAQAEDVTYDRRSRRMSAMVWVGPRPGERRASLRVTGVVVETVETAVLTRALARGEAVQASDVTVERRPREAAPPDAEPSGGGVVGRVARRALAAGSILRAGDLARPELVARGDAVTITYEVPGMVLTLRGRANEAGALGDTVAVLNPQSKKILPATVTGPGRVSVSAPPPGRVAAVEPRSQPAQP